MSERDQTLAEKRRRAMLREAGGPMMRLNMTPMIDVVFLLLIYFVLVADFARPASIAGLDVVQQESASDDPFALPQVPTALEVSSVGDGRTDFALRTEQPVFNAVAPLDEIAESAIGVLGSDHPIVVRPEADARWEHAVVVYRTLREAGFDRVELTPEQR